MQDERPLAVVIGAGIGGLTAAIALRRVGWNVTVFERARTIGDVGAGITLWANATRVLRQLEIGDAVITQGRQFPRGAVRAPDGATLAVSEPGAIDATVGSPTIAIHRSELHACLTSALPPDAIVLGAACNGVRNAGDRAVASFADGRSIDADLIIGADGINSVVRRSLLPNLQLRYSGYTAFRGIANAEWNTTSETWGVGRRFGIVPLQRGRVYWFATENAPEGREIATANRRNHLLALFGEWHEPIPALLQATPDEAILQNDIRDMAPAAGWSRGRIVLLGDAIHPTTPNLGQGACMAIESAAALAEELARSTNVEEGLEAYERRRRGRTATITNESWKIGRLGQLDNAFLCQLRDLLVRLTPTSLTRRRLISIVARSY